jgi:hypothetical protein
LGGGGYTSIGKVDVGGSSQGNAFELGMGFGGVVLEYIGAIRSRYGIGAGVLVGGGNARVRDPIVGTELGSDNFIVLQPEAVIRVQLLTAVEAALSLGYRLVGGVEDLPGLRPGDLRSYVASLSIRVP